ncbi:NADH:flavin oxidoreductase/NADH oxidase family protein [Mesorhizobium sp. NZP2298]|uniref:NADH:flavin oxidoreductase/NADH oxidase family protein n=1 Tax=Mesorhizobium sp. NZP2298 TaxID=2483403 RepID=UPI0015570576|nr:NADH:flavin oxidoreductase/NADH oxidase family protein [Mesorhizobium sp. NZP2298]QKC98343.1 NADH:flavin oxidoreductase/NADH oxidase family protein [Mesorhizobium sp. NZP2298]
MTAVALDTPLNLPCGAVLPNRLGKSAMTEGLADPFGRATEDHVRLYRRWGEGGTGLLLTGNIQVDRRSLERPGNIRIEGPQDAEQMKRLSALASAAQHHGAKVWGQIAHAGRQAPADACPDPVAPSAVPLKMLRWTQKAPRALTESEIEDLISRFGNAGKVLKQAGFDGVQLHGAHGYLISEFLSPSVNLRTDKWGGSLENRARFLMSVLRAVRQSVGPDFPVGLKLNSADFQKGGFSHAESLQVVEWLNNEGLDLLEITGGTYEHLSMIGVKIDNQFDREPARASTKAREAYFAVYAADARRIAKMPVMATGGFRRRDSMVSALNDGTCDLVGLARPLCVDPTISKKLVAGSSAETQTLEYTMKLSDEEKAGLDPDELQISTVLGQQAFFFLTLFDMGEGKDPDTSRSLPVAQRELAAREAAITAALTN